MKYPKRYEEAYQELVKDLKERYDQLGSYKKLAADIGKGISSSYLHQILHYGYRPTGGKNAEKLGLPKLMLVPRLVLSRKPRKQQKRVRIDIADISPEHIKKIRSMSTMDRTLALFAAAYEIDTKHQVGKPCPTSPTGHCLYNSSGTCIYCQDYQEDMDHRSEEEK